MGYKHKQPLVREDGFPRVSLLAILAWVNQALPTSSYSPVERHVLRRACIAGLATEFSQVHIDGVLKILQVDLSTARDSMTHWRAMPLEEREQWRTMVKVRYEQHMA